MFKRNTMQTTTFISKYNILAETIIATTRRGENIKENNLEHYFYFEQ